MPNATAPSKKWYVFDEQDCFGNHNTATQAAEWCDAMASDEFPGLHIVQMTEEQFAHYCKHNDLKAALKL